MSIYRFALVVVLLVAALLPMDTPARADEGWVIRHFDAKIAIQPDGALDIVETIQVDFGTLERHGIFREIPVRYDYDEEMDRVYDVDVEAVTDANGRPHEYVVEEESGWLTIRIGDPDVTVSGPQSYKIEYQVRHALNAFATHDELYWNVTPTWPVPIERLTATVSLPSGTIPRVLCFQGLTGSTDTCRSSIDGRVAFFEATRVLDVDEQATVVVAIPKGTVPEPTPRLERKPREFDEFFEATPLNVGGSLALGAVVAGALGWSYWSFGRDRRYATMYYLTDDPSEETRPLLSSDPIVVEYTPPEGLRPAQIGLLLDERADTLDVTATIVDLAVRGYLKIAEVPKEGILSGIFGRDDWELTRTDRGGADLLDYERIILNGLFEHGSPARLSALERKFYRHLDKAQKSLYEDAVRRKWFAARPDRVRNIWIGIGIAGIVVGLFGVFTLGQLFGAGLIAVPVIAGGIFTLGMSQVMPKRTALGSELLRRTLGFRQYVATAEKDRQRFNEQQNLFAEYLPYAIVFHCVDKWARAFEGIDTEPTTRTWYTGTSQFSPVGFSRRMQGFSTAVGTAIASTPGGSGSSGFSGGGAGGGGGGGGGGSW